TASGAVIYRYLDAESQRPAFVNLPATDPEGDFNPISYVITAAPTHGKLYQATANVVGMEIVVDTPTLDNKLPNNRVAYISDPDFVGVDSFEYQVGDASTLNPVPAKVFVRVNPVC